MRVLILLIATSWLITACREPSNNRSAANRDTTPYTPKSPFVSAIEKGEAEETDCDQNDGLHDASVDYYNPKTGHTARYELKVHVKDCKVIRIDFPKGGWLDEDHIAPTPINKTNEAVLTDDKGRQWKVHLN